MKNESSTRNASLDSASDPQLERLLEDAYDVPAMPRSLLKRLDAAVGSEWGQSPGLIQSPVEPWRAALSLHGGWVRWSQVAASLAIVIALVIVFRGDTRAYGWAAMLRALADQGMVEVEADGQIRWLSLSQGMLGERSGDGARLLDARQRIVLERRADGTEVRRRRLPQAVANVNDNRLALGLLLGDLFSPEGADKLSGLRVIEESWQSQTVEGREQIALTVCFESAAAQQYDVLLMLDPATHLPLACTLYGRGGANEKLALSYPTQSARARREQDFPAHLAVVDADEQPQPSSSVATATEPSAVEPSPDENAVSATAASTAVPAIASAEATADQPPMFGAPSKWQPVQANALAGAEVVRQIDALLSRLWAQQSITPAEPADDEELLRRVYLDLTGRTPSVNEVRAYLNDDASNRYEALVDRLLKSPDHASHIATVWRTFLIPEGVDLTRFGGVEAFDQWLAQQLAHGAAYDQIVRSLLMAEGRLSRSGPLLFYSAVKLDADQLASRTARVFLGMRLECAQCHDHPFEPWTQQDFWSFAAFFARISRPQAKLEAVSTVMQVRDVDRGEVMLPETDLTALPKFLNSVTPADAAGAARREQLAHWLTSAENPYFARATANRVWGHLFGKGIVDPVDDFGTQHAPKSPELLDLLAGHFIHGKFSLRELFRAVALSKAYRLSSGAATVDPERLEWFAQMNIKTLTAEQIYDCITVATLLDTSSVADPYALNVARFGNTSRDEFVRQFRTPAGRNTEYLGGIPQALTLMNGTLIDSATGLSTSGLLKSLEAPIFSNEQRVEVLYLATLSRQPRPTEWKLLNDLISHNATGSELQEGLADLLWALLNSAEFTLNH